MALKWKETEHSYYCSDHNYYADGYRNWGKIEHANWQEFADSWLDDDGVSLDDDLNHLFRFDIKGDEEHPGRFYLELFFIMQREGNFVPVVIHSIAEDELSQIETFLKQRWEYLKSQWEEFSEKKGRWIERDGKTWCSACGASNKAYKPPFCPHCGAHMSAKMDGEK